MLLNRKYGSRLECLYYILSSCYAKYKTTEAFMQDNLKYDANDDNNVHEYCKLLQNKVGRLCCPYLKNSLNSSKCYATQSVCSDSTKSKAVSDVVGSLEALGFIEHINEHQYKITGDGEKWVNSDFNSAEWEDIARNGVLSYGVIIGFLNKISELPDEFSYKGIYTGYPHTTETVEYTAPDGNVSLINISTDSQYDSNSRTTSRLIGWCVAVGLIEPKGVEADDSLPAHIKYRDFLNKRALSVRKFIKTELCKTLFDNKLYVSNPLSYSKLHKNVESLRENGGEDLRAATLLHKPKILDRRYVFVYALNYYSRLDRVLDFEKLINAMENHAEHFFQEGSDAMTIMSSECDIGDIAGIPFAVENGTYLRAKTTINECVLNDSAPHDSITLAKRIIEEMEAM